MALVALISHPACLGHDPGLWHPERPSRLTVVLDALAAPGFVGLQHHSAPCADDEVVALVHPPAHLAMLRRLHASGARVDIDADTAVLQGTLEAVLRAAGGGVLAVDLVMDRIVERAFVAVRPPGHHAEPAQAMGFCLLNNAAIAARYAVTHHHLPRVAIIDFDVHHGNGSQTVCATDQSLLYVSSHQMPCYPGTGARDETGGGRLVNMPLPPGCGSAQFRAAWTQTGLPAIADFAPSLLVISAGFDAHRDDPLAQIDLQTEDFGWLTAALVDLANTCCEGRIVSMLEGGYDLQALAASAAAHVAALMQD